MKEKCKFIFVIFVVYIYYKWCCFSNVKSLIILYVFNNLGCIKDIDIIVLL